MSSLKLNYFKQQIIELYENKVPISSIAKQFNCYQQPVINLLKKYNVYNPRKLNQGNIRYFQKIDSNIKAYFLGFITADGCIIDNGKGSKGLSITIHRKDIKILETLKSQIGCDNPIMHITTKSTHNPTKNKNHVRFSLFNKYLYADLLSLGLTERKSLTVPSIINNIPYEFRDSFILGYFDGDGSVTLPKINNPNITTIVVSFRGTKDFLKDLPLHLNLDSFYLKKDPKKQCYTLCFSAKRNVKKFFEIYKNNDFYLTRKYKKFLQRINKV